MTREDKKRLLAEIEKQYKWLMTKSPTIYMMDIAFDAIRKAVRDEAEQEPDLDKIRADIKHHSEHFINDDGEDCLALYEDDVVEIFDKYRAEREGKR